MRPGCMHCLLKGTPERAGALLQVILQSLLRIDFASVLFTRFFFFFRLGGREVLLIERVIGLF